jgi:hypothetical protein
MKKFYLSLLLLVAGSLFAGNGDFSPGSNLAFYPNVGQFTNDLGQVATNVHYRATVGGLEFYLTDEGLSYVFIHHNNDEFDPALGGSPTPNFRTTTDFGRIDMVLVGAELDAQTVVHEAPTTDFFNYYTAHCPDGRTSVRGYQRISYPNVYPNIDWVIYSEDGQKLKYEFVVHPGGNPNDIQIAYRYADVEVGEKTIQLTTPRGQISEQALYAYVRENNQVVPATYIQDGPNRVRIQTEMPATGTLVIDPPLVWASYLGSSGEEQPQALVTGNGYVIVAGYCNTTVFPTANPGGGAYFQGTLGGGYDAWFTKFDTSGVRLWSTYYGGSSDEGSTSYTGVSIATGLNNTLWLVGTTNSTNLPVQNGGGGAYYQGTNAGGFDFFIARFGLNSGVRQHATYYGGTSTDGGTSHGNGADCDAAGNLYFAGLTASSNFPMLNPGGGAYYNPALQGSDDIGIVKLSPTGVLLWGTIFGGSSDDINYSMDLHVDRQNARLYLGTCSMSTNAPCLNPGGGAFFDNTNNGGTDVYLARFTLGGVQNWGTYYGGSGDEWLSMSLATAPDGDLAMMTLTGSTNIPMVTPGGPAFHDNTHNGGTWDMFVTRFQSNMSLYWNTFYGSSNNDHCQHNLTMDYGGRIITIGVSDGTAPPVTYNPGVGHFYNGVKDAQGTYCIVQYDTTCAMMWGTFYGGSGHDHLFGTVGGCIGVSEHSDIFVAAETNSTDLTLVNPGGGAYFQNTNAGGSKEGFILKFNNDLHVVILDLSLINLTGERDGNTNLLRWEVGANSSAQRFLVEHEIDNDFKLVGGMEATGATQYSFSDINPIIGTTNRYRLKIYDQNGYFTYSNVVEIRDAGAGVEVDVWPNPANDRVNLKLQSDGQRNLRVRITDLTGRVMMQKEYAQSGIWENDFSSWSRGSYILTVVDGKTGEQVYSKQLVLQ